MKEARVRRTAGLLGCLLVAPLPVVLAAAPAAATEPAVVRGTAAVVAGAGQGDGAPAVSARFHDPLALAYAPDGDLVVATVNDVRRVESADGTISTVVSVPHDLSSVRDVATGPDGSLYVADEVRVRRIAPDGTTSFVAGPDQADLVGVAVAADGTVFLTGHEAGRGTVWRSAGGSYTRVAGGPATDELAGVANELRLREVGDVELTPEGDLLVHDRWYWRVLRIAGGAPAGAVTTVAGHTELGGAVVDGAAPTSGKVIARDLAVAADGTVYFTDMHAGLRRFGATVETVDTGGVKCGYSVAIAPDGTVAAYCGGRYVEVPGDGTLVHLAGGPRAADGTAAQETWFLDLRDVSVAGDGATYLADGGEVRSIVNGVLGTVATGDVDVRHVAAAAGEVFYAGERSVYRNGALVAGSPGAPPPMGAGSPRTTDFGEIVSIAAGPDGELYVAGLASCSVWRVETADHLTNTGVPACPGAVDLEVGDDGTLYATGAAGLWSYTQAGGARRLDPAWTGPADATPDGIVHGATASLLPDGAVMTQEYGHHRTGVPEAFVPTRLSAEPGGTLATIDDDRLVRLTPAQQQVPPAVTAMVVNGGPGTLTVTWSVPPGGGFGDYVVRVLPGPAPPAFHEGVEAARVPSGTSSVVLRTGHADDPPGLRGGQEYTVSVWRVAATGRSAPFHGSGVPEPETVPPPAPAIDVTYDRDGGVVRVAVTPAGVPDHHRWVARLGATAPGTPADGQPPDTVSGDEAAFFLGDVEGTFAVAVWAFDVYGNRSEPATATVVADRTPPAPVDDLVLFVAADSIVAHWSTPDPAVTRVVATSSTDGVPRTLPAGAGKAAWPVPAWGASYTVTLTAYDAAGNASEPVEATIVARRATMLTIARSAHTVTYGDTVWLRGTLTDDLGRTYAGRTVELWRRRVGQASFVKVAQRPTDGDGNVAIPRKPDAHAEYQLRLPQSADLAAARSAVTRVLVRARVTIAAADTRVPAGTTAYLTGTMLPAHAGTPLTLQRYVTGTGWQPVATARTSSASRVRFAVRKPPGTYHYRMWFAGHADHGRNRSLPLRLTVE